MSKKRKRSLAALDLDERTSYRDFAKIIDVHYMTVYRWIREGVNAGNRRVYLRNERRQGKRLVTRRWYEQFIAEQQEDGAVREEYLRGHDERIQNLLDRELASATRRSVDDQADGPMGAKSAHGTHPTTTSKRPAKRWADP